MKLKLTVTAFFDKVKDEYVYKAETPVIERDEERGRQLIKAGVCEEYVEPKKPRKKKAEPEEPEKTESDN